ncbi:TrmH family RNA methyltransferase [Tenacibaculum amylolyticum]|uniref:TrmH family RNA methyltransferase n=1 Tax=Tenacibaculum amylolyticum TaxID=104269 RepID=UPI0038954782
MSLSKNHIKLVNSLRQKKYRQQHGLFVAEGVKVIHELLASELEVETIFAIDDFDASGITESIIRIAPAELKKISGLKTPNQVLGVFKIPKQKPITDKGLVVALDTINDPGNLGTIIRLCDWFGITELICSKDTVDVYNQKVIQSTMGSVTRVSIVYTNLTEVIQKTQLPVYAADMDGDNIYETKIPTEAMLVMGNEANGISKEIEAIIQHKLTIPRFGTIQKTESLNVATATAILLSEFRRGLK